MADCKKENEELMEHDRTHQLLLYLDRTQLDRLRSPRPATVMTNIHTLASLLATTYRTQLVSAMTTLYGNGIP